MLIKLNIYFIQSWVECIGNNDSERPTLQEKLKNRQMHFQQIKALEMLKYTQEKLNNDRKEETVNEFSTDKESSLSSTNRNDKYSSEVATRSCKRQLRDDDTIKTNLKKLSNNNKISKNLESTFQSLQEKEKISYSTSIKQKDTYKFINFIDFIYFRIFDINLFEVILDTNIKNYKKNLKILINMINEYSQNLIEKNSKNTSKLAVSTLDHSSSIETDKLENLILLSIDDDPINITEIIKYINLNVKNDKKFCEIVENITNLVINIDKLHNNLLYFAKHQNFLEIIVHHVNFNSNNAFIKSNEDSSQQKFAFPIKFKYVNAILNYFTHNHNNVAGKYAKLHRIFLNGEIQNYKKKIFKDEISILIKYMVIDAEFFYVFHLHLTKIFINQNIDELIETEYKNKVDEFNGILEKFVESYGGMIDTYYSKSEMKKKY